MPYHPCRCKNEKVLSLTPVQFLHAARECGGARARSCPFLRIFGSSFCASSVGRLTEVDASRACHFDIYSFGGRPDSARVDRLRIAFAIILALGGTPCAFGRPDDSVGRTPGREVHLAGTVRTGHGEVLPKGLTIALSRSHQPSSITLNVADDGRFRFDGIDVGAATSWVLTLKSQQWHWKGAAQVDEWRR